jgi:hypothetical protein
METNFMNVMFVRRKLEDQILLVRERSVDVSIIHEGACPAFNSQLGGF